MGRLATNADPKPLRVCIDARLTPGAHGGVEQVVIGFAGGLSALEDAGDEYVFLVRPEQEEVLREHVGGPCRLMPLPEPRTARRLSGWSQWQRARPFVRAGLTRVPAIRRARPGLLPRAPRVVAGGGFDLVHFATQQGFLAGDLPTVYTPHDLQHLHLPEFFTRGARTLREVEYRALCEAADLVVAQTTWVKSDLVRQYGLPEDKVTVIPWASVLAQYPKPSAADAEALRARLGLPPRFAFYPAQSWPHKNHVALFDALAELRAAGLEVPLVCSGGGGPQRDELEAAAGRRGVTDLVTWTGYVSPVELRALYDLAHVMAFPSRFEGWGLPVLEAFEAELPVAVSSVTSLPRLVGDAALTFDPLDSAALGHAVARLWTDADLRATLTAKGKARVQSFSWERTARSLRAHYRMVAGRALLEHDRILLAAEPPV
jgi:glycosyltransferase involved in cell wall biosynthesis